MKSLAWGMLFLPISTYKVGAFHHAESHPSYFTLSCKVLQCTLWRCQQQHIICKKQKCYSEFPKQKCSLSWPCLEILSMKIKDRIGTPCSYSIAVRCPRDFCKGVSLLQIYKTYIDWIVKLLWFHQQSYKGKDLVNFHGQEGIPFAPPESKVQQSSRVSFPAPKINFPSKVVIGAHPAVPLC